MITWLQPKKWTRRRVVIIGFITLAVFIAAISSNLVSRSFTSDDVVQQAIAHNFTQAGPHTVITNSDTYILKLPFYWAFNTFTHPGRLQLILESLLFNVAMIGLLAVWWKNAAPKTSHTWLVFAWLVAAGTFWMSQTVNPNTRNFQLGLMILFVLVTIKKVQRPPVGKKSSLLYILGGGLLAGILSYDDPYFLFFISLPLLVALFAYSYRQKRYLPLISFGSALIISLVVYKFLGLVFAHFGISVTNNSSISRLGGGTTNLNDLPGKFGQLVNYYLSLLGASPSDIRSNIWILIRVVSNFSVVCLAAASLYHFISKRKFTLTNIWIITTLVTSLSYLLLTPLYTIYTFRYLIILVPITALLAALSLQRLAKGRSKYYHLAVAAVVISLACNIIQSAVTIYQKHDDGQPNLVDYQIIRALDRNGVTKSYANYWVANISYYLSGYDNNVLPTQCVNGAIYKYPEMLDTQRFQAPAAKTGILVSSGLIIPTVKPYPSAPSCTVQTTIRQFGAPQSIIPVAPSVYLLIYNHNPWARSSAGTI